MNGRHRIKKVDFSADNYKGTWECVLYFGGEEDKSVADIIYSAIQSSLARVNTSAIGEITTINGNSVDIEILNPNGENVIVPNVPVVQPNGSAFSIVYPLSVGDTGAVVFCKNPIDPWKKDGTVLSVDKRQFSLTDALFFPGVKIGSDISATLKIAVGNVIIELSNTEAVMDATTIKLGAAASESAVLGNILLGQLQALTAWADAHTHGTPAVTPPPTTPSPPFDNTMHSIKVVVE